MPENNCECSTAVDETTTGYVSVDISVSEDVKAGVIAHGKTVATDQDYFAIGCRNILKDNIADTTE